MCDRYWVDYDNTQNMLLVGSRADYGSTAGFNSTNSSGNVNANVSLRYFFFVFFLNFILGLGKV